MNTNTGIIRIGVFYDGSYFKKVSDYYKYHHDRQARLSLSGMHSFIRHQVAEVMKTELERCKITEAHYFRGRLSAKTAIEQNALEYERKFDEVLMRAGISQHYFPMDERTMTERGVDMWLAMETYDMAIHKGFDVVCMIACDGDYVPLIKKLSGIGTPVMLLAWDISDTNTRTSQALIDCVSYPVMMMDEVDSRSRKSDQVINDLFVGGYIGGGYQGGGYKKFNGPSGNQGGNIADVIDDEDDNRGNT